MFFCTCVNIHYIICDCGSTFPTEDELKNHLETQHTNGIILELQTSQITINDKVPKDANNSDRSNNIKKKRTANLFKNDTMEVQEKTNAKIDIFQETLLRVMGLKHRFIKSKSVPEEVLNKTVISVSKLTFEEAVKELESRQERKRYMEAPHHCQFCYRHFYTQEKYDEHMLEHDEVSGSLMCRVCKVRRRNKRALFRHAINSHTRKYSCKICPFKTTYRCNAYKHITEHQGARYMCPHCAKEFTSISTLNTHVRVKHPARNACALCGYTFLTELGVKVHHSMKHRFDDQTPLAGPYCATCDVRFLSQEAHDRHLRLSALHVRGPMTTRMYKQFLNRPINTNKRVNPRGRRARTEDTGPISCDQCGAAVRSKRTLLRHYRSAHAGAAPARYPAARACHLCGKTYLTDASMQAHVTMAHGEQRFPCDVCGRQYAHPMRLRLHARIHARTHARTRAANDVRHTCTICAATFTLKFSLQRHMMLHTGVKPYRCEICLKSFATKQEKVSHVKYTHMKIPRPPRAPRRRPRDVIHDGGGSNDNVKSPDDDDVKRLSDAVRSIIGDVNGPNPYDVGSPRHDTTDPQDTRDPDDDHLKCGAAVRGKPALLRRYRSAYAAAALARYPAARACPLCGKMYWSDASMQTHVTKVHAERRFTCNVCGRQYAHNVTLLRHARNVHAPAYASTQHAASDVTRTMCVKGDIHDVGGSNDKVESPNDDDASLLNDAVRSIIGDVNVPNQSDVGSPRHDTTDPQDTRDPDDNHLKCGAAVRGKPALLRRYRSMHAGAARACHLCGKMYRSDAILLTHITKVHAERRFTCNVCGRQYAHNKTLRRHARDAHAPAYASTQHAASDVTRTMCVKGDIHDVGGSNDNVESPNDDDVKRLSDAVRSIIGDVNGPNQYDVGSPRHDTTDPQDMRGPDDNHLKVPGRPTRRAERVIRGPDHVKIRGPNHNRKDPKHVQINNHQPKQRNGHSERTKGTNFEQFQIPRVHSTLSRDRDHVVKDHDQLIKIRQDQLIKIQPDQLQNIQLDQLQKIQPDQLQKIQPDQLKKIQPEQLKKIQPDQLKKIRPDQLKKIQPDQLEKIQSDQLKKIQPDQLQNIQLDQLQKIQPDQLQKIQPDQLKKIQPEQLKKIQPDQLKKIRPDQLKKIQPDQLEKIQSDQLKKIQPDQLKKIQPDQLKKIQPDQLKKIRPDQLKNIQPDQLQKIQPDPLKKIQSNQLKKIQPDPLKKIQPDQLKKIRPDQLKKIQPDQLEKIQSDQLKKIQPDQLKKIQPDQLKKIQPDQLKKIRPDQLKNIQPDQLQKIQPDQLKKIQPDQLKKIQPDQLKKIQPDQLKKIQPDQLKKIRPDQLQKIRLDQLKKIQPDQLQKTQPDQLKKIQPAQVQKIQLDQLKMIQPDQVKEIRPDQLYKTRLDQLKKIQPEQLQKIRLDQQKKVQPDQLKKIRPDRLKRICPDQLKKTDRPDHIQIRGSRHVDSREPNHVDISLYDHIDMLD